MAETVQPVADTGFTTVYRPVGTPKMECGAPILKWMWSRANGFSIIFVHGLQGHPRNTWSTRADVRRSKASLSRLLWGSAEDEASQNKGSVNTTPVFWPKDLLYDDCPECRIMTWGYDSHVSKFFGGPTNQNNFFDHAKNLLYALDRDRAECQGRGIIFVAHSLGGIIVKEVLRRAQSDDQQSITDIYHSTRGICFLGTPHRGSSLAPLGETARRIAAAAGFDTNDRNIRALYFDSIESQLSREEFTRIWRTGSFEIRTFQESQGMTGLKGFNGKVVPDFSSSMDDTRERPQHIDANHMEMCRFHSRDTTGYNQVAGEIKSLVAKHANTIRSQQIDQLLLSNADPKPIDAENEILQSLAFPELDSRRQRIGRPSQNTCAWLASLPIYRDWSSQGHGFIWIKGKIGAGKSTLMRSAFESIRDASRGSETIVVGYFHDARGASLEKSLLGLFRSIAYQCFIQDRRLLSEYVASSAQARAGIDAHEKERKWELGSLQEMCLTVVRSRRPAPVFIFIDALDEGDTSQIRKLLRFWEQAMVSAVSNRTELRVCLSMRLYPNISLQGCPEILMEQHNRADISTYVRQTLGSVATDQEAQNLVSIIIAKASGVFLWVVLVVEILLEADDNGETFTQKLSRLERLPSELEELFTLIIHAIPTEERQDTFQILKSIAFAPYNLLPIELCFAMSLETSSPVYSLAAWKHSAGYIKSFSQMSKLLRSRSKGLVEIKTVHTGEFGPRILFIHESLPNFLLRKGFQILAGTEGDNIIGRCHGDLALSCLRYLSNPELYYHSSAVTEPSVSNLWQTSSYHLESPTRSDQIDSQLDQEDFVNGSLENHLERHCPQDKRTQFPFLNYSATYLFFHARKAELLGVPQTHLAEGLSGRHTRVFGYWTDLALEFRIRRDNFEGDPSTLLQRLIIEGIASAVYELIQQPDMGPGLNMDRALRIAVSAGEKEIVDVLLTAGANPAASSGCGSSALHIVSTLGSVLIARSLIQGKAPVNQTTMFGWTPLHYAADAGRVEVLQVLLNAKADTEIRNADGETPMMVAARKGFVNIYYALLTSGANLHTTDDFGHTVLHTAARFRNYEILRYLLETKYPAINTRNIDGRTALNLLAYSRASSLRNSYDKQQSDHELAQLLIARGATTSEFEKPQGLLNSPFTSPFTRRFRISEDFADVPARTMTASPTPWQMARLGTGSALPRLSLPDNRDEPPTAAESREMRRGLYPYDLDGDLCSNNGVYECLID